jgi:hypothetical protein
LPPFDPMKPAYPCSSTVRSPSNALLGLPIEANYDSCFNSGEPIFELSIFS